MARLYVASGVAACAQEFLSLDAFYIVGPICLPFKDRALEVLIDLHRVGETPSNDDGRFDRYDAYLTFA